MAASYYSPNCQRQFPINALKITPLLMNPMTHNMVYINVVTAVISIDISPRLCASPYRLL